ncbi:zinc finger protein 205 isoform X1 [Etheostoma cragini]|uniref:zinc finger protein 205 isoform X1 n=1 Tax=Etheostoma cragini TaxID=417921 RepID=UPI00155F07EF|nr:zinc finger protein 205 isoform X1 [Etheostoma cragini]
MADSSSSILTSSERPAVGGGTAGKATSSSVVSGNGNWDGAGGMDQITVVRIDDTHIKEEQCQDGGKVKDTAQYEMEYLVPAAEEEEEEDGVYVIEYSNPEEEGESYQFTMSVDKSLPSKKPIITHPVAGGESARSPPPVLPKPSVAPRPRPGARHKRKLIAEEEKEEEVLSNKSVLELGEHYSDVMGVNSGVGPSRLVCTLCPPPGKFFKRGSGLAVHLKHMHNLDTNKRFFCVPCQRSVRTQIELDRHTKRHANKAAVFTCHLCPAEAGKRGYKGSRWGLRSHLETEHPGVVPRCHICNKGFQSVVTYLADQFRHVGVSPHHCAKCQIYEMTERGLLIHIKNHDKKKQQQVEEEEELEVEVEEVEVEEVGETPPQMLGVSANGDNSATDDSDF